MTGQTQGKLLQQKEGITIFNSLGFPVKTVVNLPVEICMDVDWRELHRLLKVSFPVAVYAQEGMNEIRFGYIKRPVHRSGAYDKERFEVCNHRYSALCDGTHGAVVLNDSKYGISMNKNRLELSLLKAASRHLQRKRRADNRRHSFTYAFSGWEGSFAERCSQAGL